jgi:hypothetical protein
MDYRFRKLSDYVPDMLDKVKIKLEKMYPDLIIALEGTWTLTITSRNTSTLTVYYESKGNEGAFWTRHVISYDTEELKYE